MAKHFSFFLKFLDACDIKVSEHVISRASYYDLSPDIRLAKEFGEMWMDEVLNMCGWIVRRRLLSKTIGNETTPERSLLKMW